MIVNFRDGIYFDSKRYFAFSSKNNEILIPLITPIIINNKIKGTWFNIYDARLKRLSSEGRYADGKVIYIPRYLPEAHLLDCKPFRPINRAGYFDRSLFIILYEEYCSEFYDIVTKTLVEINPTSIRNIESYMTLLALMKGRIMGLIKH